MKILMRVNEAEEISQDYNKNNFRFHISMGNKRDLMRV